MTEILPFKGFRPPREIINEVAAPPYDVISSSESRKYVKDKPKNYLHISRPEIDLPEGTDEHDPKVYLKGKENFEMFKKNGWIVQDKEDCYYFYRQKMGTHIQTGLVCCASCDDYDNDIIKKHEHTRKDKEEDRTKHVNTIGANTEPVFFTYKAQPQIDKIINNWISSNEPIYNFTSDDNVHHELWVCSDLEVINNIKNYFSKINYLYVADGHHRSAAASRVRALRKSSNPSHTGKEQYNYFLTVCFPDNQMNIMAYNRVVKDLYGLSKEEFLSAINKDFIVKADIDYSIPKAHNNFCMYLDGSWYLLQAKENSFDKNDPVSKLDASILQNNLLSPILKIQNPRTDKRINFIGGIKGSSALKKAVDSKEYSVAFSLYPLSISQLIETADAGKVMPPKSTWFEPKLKSGLFIHEI